MNKSIFISIATLMLLSACSQTETVEVADGAAASAEPAPIAFSTYTGNATGTRGGKTGIMDDTELKSTGFGVFAYHTDGSNYSSSDPKPNFMWNQEVTYASEKWTYTPLKYWPNEFGDNAESENTDKLSFFAYAPYVSSFSFNEKTWTLEAASGEFMNGSDTYSSQTGVEGITKLSGNDASGDPVITYVAAADPAKSVDLLWGVNSTYNTTGSGYTGPTASEWTGTTGEPYIDMDKMPIDKNVKFTFKHALTRLGITIQGMYDKMNNTGDLGDKSDAIKDHSKVVVEKIVLKGPFRLAGTLSLNNKDKGNGVANWTVGAFTRAASDVSSLTLTEEGTTTESGGLGAKFADSFKYESGKKANEHGVGVTETRKDIFTGDDVTSSSNRNYYMFVPEESGSTAGVTVTIKYHVITDDAALDGGKIDITNEITQTLDHGVLNFASGKANDLNLVLGLTSVKVEASVSDWDSTGSNIDVNLPVNSTTTP